MTDFPVRETYLLRHPDHAAMQDKDLAAIESQIGHRSDALLSKVEMNSCLRRYGMFRLAHISVG